MVSLLSEVVASRRIHQTYRFDDDNFTENSTLTYAQAKNQEYAYLILNLLNNKIVEPTHD